MAPSDGPGGGESTDVRTTAADAGAPIERPSTIPVGVPTASEERRYRAGRRVALAGLTLFVLVGLSGRLGVRTTEDHGSDGALRVALHHATVARPALAVPYRLTIRRAGGFDEPIEVRITTAYLASFDENGTQPQPDSSTTDERDTIWEFPPPEGTVFTVWLDTRIEPSVQWRRPGATTVVHGDEVVTIDHPLWILP